MLVHNTKEIRMLIISVVQEKISYLDISKDLKSSRPVGSPENAAHLLVRKKLLFPQADGNWAERGAPCGADPQPLWAGVSRELPQLRALTGAPAAA